MENSLSGLMMAAGTVITCMIISLAFFLAREGKGMVLEASNQMQEAKYNISEQGLMEYDRVYVTGNQVIGAVKKYENEYTVTVVTDKEEITFPVGDMELIYDKESDYYISPGGKFWSSVSRNASGIITGFLFEQR
jgi:hypothetical protein